MLVNFFGKRGSGKTFTIKHQLQKCRPPVVVVDILGNFQQDGQVLVTDNKTCIEWILHYAKTKDQDSRIIVLQTSDPNLSIDFVSAALFHAGGGTLVIDEADAFNESMAPCFDELVRYGRNRNVDIITGCRRPFEISRNITAGANQLFVFQTQEPRDIEYYRSTILGDRAYELSRMKQHHGLFVDYDRSHIGEFRVDKTGLIFKLEVTDLYGSSQSDGMVPETDFEETHSTGVENVS